MEQGINIFRRRYEPDEIIELRDDVILHRDEDYLLTKWESLKPRADISHGISAYFLKENFKVSKVFDKNHQLIYWYCDIIRTEYDSQKDSYVFIDLLIDVLIYGDGTVKVVDLDEMAELISQNRITKEETALALRATDSLLKKIHDGSFEKYQEIINEQDS